MNGKFKKVFDYLLRRVLRVVLLLLAFEVEDLVEGPGKTAAKPASSFGSAATLSLGSGSSGGLPTMTT